jgi:Flp pilus assembly protein TadG
MAECTLVLCTALLLLFAIFEYGRFIMIRHVLDNAAREGARMAIANTQSLTTTDIQNCVNTCLANQPVNLSTFNVYKADPSTGANIGQWTDAAFGDAIAVDLQGSYQPILPTLGFLPNPVTLKAKVLMRSEAN